MKLANILCHPVATFLAFKDNVRRRSPIEKWHFVRDIGSFFMRSIGVYILEPRKVVNLRMFLPGLALVDYFLLLLYTFYLYQDNVMRAIQPLCVIGVVAPSAICYTYVMIRPTTYRSLIFFGAEHVYPLRSSSDKSRESYDDSAVMLIRSSLTILAAITLSSIAFALYPMYTYVFEDEHPMTIPVILPFTDPETSLGYYLNVSNQLFISFTGILGNIGIEIISSMMVNNMWVGVSSIQCALDEFSDFIRHKPLNVVDTERRLRTILMRIRDLDRYIVQLTDFYYWKFLLQPLLITFSVSISVFSQMMANWTSGYGCGLFTYTQLIILCYMGNVVQIANQRLSVGLWNVPWYLLPPKYQKMLQIMLHRIQNSARITIGPFAELSLEMATHMTKIIYKFLMILMRFAE